MITVRKATEQDASVVIGLMTAMEREDPNPDLGVALLQRGVSSALSDSTKGEYWVAEVDKEVVGALLTVSQWRPRLNGFAMWIHDAYVKPDMRRQGVFTAMFKALQDQVTQTNTVKSLRLHTNEENEAARRLYESLGMEKADALFYSWSK